MNAGQIIIATAVEGLELDGNQAEAVEELQDRVDIIRHKLKFIEKKPVVAFITMLEPLMLDDGLTAQLIEVAGGTPTGEIGNLQKWDTIRLADPEIVILALQNYSIGETIKDIDLLIGQPGFNELTAVKNNRIYIADGKKYFHSKGVEIIDSLEILAEIINPKQFIFGYEGEGWVKFEV